MIFKIFSKKKSEEKFWSGTFEQFVHPYYFLIFFFIPNLQEKKIYIYLKKIYQVNKLN